MAPLIWGCAIVTAVIVATFLPFVPGGHDPLALPLAAVAWALGRVGVLLLPVGALWLWVTRRQPSHPVPPAWLVRTTLGAFVLIAIVAVLVAFASSGSQAAGSRLSRKSGWGSPLPSDRLPRFPSIAFSSVGLRGVGMAVRGGRRPPPYAMCGFAKRARRPV